MNHTNTKPPYDIRGLYGITPTPYSDDTWLLKQVRLAIQGGTRVIQFRDKHSEPNQRLDIATKLQTLCREYKIPLIINDDLDLALSIDADGVHLGADDTGLAEARQRLGKDKIIGISCYSDLKLAKQAEQGGANYVAFGRFYASKSKPDAHQAELEILQQAKKQLNIPIVAIGGITVDNASTLLNAGADALAVIDSLFGQFDTEANAKQFTKQFHTTRQ